MLIKTKEAELPAEMAKSDQVNDVALLKASGSFKTLPLIPSRIVRLGESVFTIGFPNTLVQGIEPKLTRGEISSLFGIQDDPRHFQISVPVQPGNSGGPLIDVRGNVVGVVTMQLNAEKAMQITGSLPQNINYATKSSYVLSLLESLPDVSSKIKEPWPARDRKFEDLVKEAQEATALVLVY